MVIKFKQKFYRDNWANYDECLNKNFKLIPDQSRFEELKKDYNSMIEMFYGKIPTFNEIITRLSKMEENINTYLSKTSQEDIEQE